MEKILHKIKDFFHKGDGNENPIEKPPEIVEIQPSRTVEVQIGGQIRLTCQVQVSGIQSQITWIRNGQSIAYGPSLYLSDVKSEDNGEYICRAENAAGFFEQTAYIYVLSQPNYDQITISPDNLLGKNCLFLNFVRKKNNIYFQSMRAIQSLYSVLGLQI